MGMVVWVVTGVGGVGGSVRYNVIVVQGVKQWYRCVASEVWVVIRWCGVLYSDGGAECSRMMVVWSVMK